MKIEESDGSVMSAQMSQEAKEALLREIGEWHRLCGLSNEQLVRECLGYSSFDDADLHVEEMMSRLWPEWPDREL